MITLKGIAEECGVSTATVSNILNGKKNVSEKTRQQVMAVIERENYSPNSIARGLRVQKTGQIGIIVEDIVQFSSPEIVEGIMATCEGQGYRTIVRNMRMYARWSDTWYDNGEGYLSVLNPILREMKANMVDGIIYVAGHTRLINCIPKDYGIPVIMTYALSGSADILSVVINDKQAFHDITEYLIHMGHRRIAVLAGYEENLHTQCRLEGYRQALDEANIEYDPSLIRFSGWQKEDGYRDGAFPFECGATACACMADRLAGGLYRYMYEHGLKVAKDMSVTGFDNQAVSEFMMPALTTVDIPLRMIGALSGGYLDKLLKGGEGMPEDDVLYVRLKLIERESVARL